MKKQFIGILLVLTFLVSACGSAPATSVNSNPASTNTSVAPITVANTETAIPTDTPVPPTETLAPTNTAEVLPTQTSTVVPTFTAQPATATNTDPCNHPLTSWTAPTASFIITNETEPQGKILLLMSVTTTTGECGWLPIYSSNFTGPEGTYSAAAYVEGKKNFKVFGSFVINGGTWRIVVRNDRIVAKGSCYPDC